MDNIKALARNIYVVFVSNFGAAPPRKSHEATPHLGCFLFSIFVATNVVWMAYRASLTSELSVREIKMPFITLEELLESDYKCVIYPC